VHALYLILERIAPNPMVTLNRAVALAETEGPLAGLALLSTLDGDERTAGHHRLLSVRAHLLEKAGDTAGAYEHYRRAAKSTASIAEQTLPAVPGPPGETVEARARPSFAPPAPGGPPAWSAQQRRGR